MTPKDKAIELISKFIKHCQECNKSEAKQCALIVVDEVLDKDGYNNDYWQEVKQEIEKL